MVQQNPVPEWLQIAQAVATTVGVIFTALGVLAALYVAAWREPRKAREDRAERDRRAAEDRKRYDDQMVALRRAEDERAAQAAEDRRRYEDQMAALQRAEDDRIIGQARKLVPTIIRADMFGPNLWTVKVSNTSNGVVSNLAVSVTALDASGNEIPDGCRQANNEISFGEGLQRLISEALSGAIGGALSATPAGSYFGQRGGMPGGNQISSLINQRLGPEVSERFRDIMLGQLVTEWQKTLTPGQFAIMAFRTTYPNARLRVVLEFEDEAGYRWRRADDGQPVRINEMGDD